MIYILVSISIFILCIFMFYLINKDTNIVDGEIIRIDKTRNLKPDIPPYTKFKITIMYSYIVNGKKYISTMIDDFGISNLLYKYIKTKSNKKILKDEYLYYVKKKNIKVKYKIKNPQDSKIKNFILKEFLFLITLAIAIGLVGGIIFYLFLRFSKR